MDAVLKFKMNFLIKWLSWKLIYQVRELIIYHNAFRIFIRSDPNDIEIMRNT